MIYLDNAATTSLEQEVLEEMLPYMKYHFGNPSSIHSHGRETKSAVERARKTIANLLNASPSEIFFTSGGTEGDNTCIKGAIDAFKITEIITSPIEHHAILHCVENLQNKKNVNVTYLSVDSKGNLDYNELEKYLQEKPNALISLMHGNNELGTLNDIETISILAKQYKAFFHSDTVQTVGHYKINVKTFDVDSLIGSAHKFHGPKGVGFTYLNSNKKITPYLFGGSQERNMRGGTENVYGIMGMAKALEISYKNHQKHYEHILMLKNYMINALIQNIKGVSFNGEITNQKSLYTILNVSFPESNDNDMLLFNLDIKNISASGGSACSSGSDLGSHVLNAVKANLERGNVRFSFSRFNTIEEIDFTILVLKELINK